MFEVSDVSKLLRVYVNVPQIYVPRVPPGTRARNHRCTEHPDKSLLTPPSSPSSQAVVAASGTTLMQLAVDNSARELLPGSYASVQLALPHDASALNVRGPAPLIFDAQGLRVATVDPSDHVHLKTVTPIARDLGSTIEIGSGTNAARIV